MWCRCGQRPPQPGAEICGACQKKSQAEFEAAKRFKTGKNEAISAALCCLAVVVLGAASLGWLMRSLVVR